MSNVVIFRLLEYEHVGRTVMIDDAALGLLWVQGTLYDDTVFKILRKALMAILASSSLHSGQYHCISWGIVSLMVLLC